MADSTNTPVDVWGDLDDFVTATVRRLRDRGMTHEYAISAVRLNIARAHGVLIANEVADERELQRYLLDAGTNVEAFARQTIQARQARGGAA